MALQMTITAGTGITVKDAYIKVDEYSCGKNNTVNARLRAYASKQASDEGLAFIEGSEDIITFSANYKDDAVNAKMQIYEFVKSEEKYSQAKDV